MLDGLVAAELPDADDPMLGWYDCRTEFGLMLDLLLDGLDRVRDETTWSVDIDWRHAAVPDDDVR